MSNIEAKLLPGMTFVSEVKVGERRNVDFVLLPINKVVKENAKEM